MTTTATTTNAASDTRTSASGPAIDTGLGLIAYRPGATPNTPDLVLYAVITMIPLLWIVLTAFKSPDDAISYPPKVLFKPSLEGYCNVFTTRSRQTQGARCLVERSIGLDSQVVFGDTAAAQKPGGAVVPAPRQVGESLRALRRRLA